MSGLWSKLTSFFGGGGRNTHNTSHKSNSKKKKSEDSVENGGQEQYKVQKVTRTYEEIELPEDKDEKETVDYTVHKATRSYDEIELPEDREEKGTIDYTVEKKPRAYEEVVLPEDNRLSQEKRPVLNYVEVEFTKPPSKKQSINRKDSKTEYADVTVKNKTVIVK
ncbi:uncharacterized protein LOC127700759 isoform X1 [Mytilus californianus]|uniref:uncharacterized protein LOC127700759 isoform X1 n=1 Tax=Mytilus californianus TaxID=6549 RepID=UPI0022481FED|nr:uncharacterized protein LOC127700759 isoform X1 [Mytilus californianus]